MKVNFITTILFACAVFFTSKAQLVENFESNTLTWTESPAKGIWQIGKPIIGPEAFEGSKLLATNLSGPYITSEDVSISSSAFIVPTATTPDEKFFLEFAQWVQLNTLAYGIVKVFTADGFSEQTYSIANYYSDNSKWTYQLLDISQFAGKQVKIKFLLDVYGDTNYDNKSNLGWYIDQISLRSSSQSALKPAVLSKLTNVGILKDSVYAQVLNFKYKEAGSLVQFEILSSNPLLLPNNSISITTSDNLDYSLTINPLKGKSGSSVVTVIAKSGIHSSEQKFTIYVGSPQPLFLEDFETNELLFWKREPEYGSLWRIGDVLNGPKSGYLSNRALAMSLEQNYRSSDGNSVKFVSNSFLLDYKENGTYSLSFMSWIEMQSCCGDRGILKVRLENGKEIELANYYQLTDKNWKELRFSLAQFEGQRIQLVLEAQLYGSSSLYNSLSGWFIDDLKIEFIGDKNIFLNNITLDHIEDVYLFDDKDKEVLIYASNKTNEQLFLSFESSNSNVVPIQSLQTRGQLGTWVLNVKANQIGVSVVKVKASAGLDLDSLSFRVIRASESQKDSLALLKIYDALNYANSDINWKNGPINTWEGVVLNASGRVSSLTVSNKMTSGYLPEELGLLDSLKILNANTSKITGKIPKSIGDLSVLETLNLQNSKFTGQIPKEIGQLKKLKVLYMSSNYLSGEIPDELGGLESLEEFDFSWGVLKTEFPSCLYRLKNLKQIKFSAQSMYGSLPFGIGNLQNLELLELRNTGLNGSIPEDFATLVKLKKVDFISNNFTSLPTNIGNMTNLEELILQYNSITQIPESIKNLKKLKGLNLAYNKFTGDFPEILTEITSLETIALNGNSFQGKVPDSIEKLVNLKGIGLAQNQFTSLSNKITSLTKITGLSLNNNLLTTIPDFSGMSSMTELLLSANFLGFGEFEANLTKYNKYYVTQSERPINYIQLNIGENITLNADVSGANNTYQWYKNDTILAGKTSSELSLVNLNKSDRANYQCIVKNTDVTGFTIKSAKTSLFINTIGNQIPQIPDTNLYLSRNSNYKYVLKLKNTDIEGDALSYSIVSKNMGAFSLNTPFDLYLGTTSNIKDTLDIIKLLVSDAKGAISFAYVKVHYDLSASAYIRTRNFNFEIDEDAVSGTEFGKVYVYDTSGTQLNYAFSYASDTNLFKIDPMTGVLSLGQNAHLDFEKIAYYNLSIKVKNGNGLTNSFSVFLEVNKAIRTPYNFKPIAEEKVFKIHRDYKAGSFVGQLEASDFENDALFYYLRTNNDWFNLSPEGVLLLKKGGFNPSKDTLFTLSVVVSDDYNGKDYFDVHVKVDFRNKGIEAFAQTFSVNENQSVGAVIGDIVAKENTGGILNYKVLEGNITIPFAFESSTSNRFIVADSALLDYETMKQFVFNVEIKSEYGDIKVIPVTINLKDVIENVGLGDMEKYGLNIFPTLVESDLTISVVLENITSVQIYDIYGSLVFNNSINNKETNLNLSNLDKGTYTVNVQFGNKTISNKIVKY